jgi:hypothetical protein
LFYRVLISSPNSGCDQAVSANATATIVPDISVTTQPTNINECVGGTAQLTVVITGGTGTISYQWQSSPSGAGTWSNATGTGSTTPTYTPPSTTAGNTDYRVLINATGNDCGQAVSQIATVIIFPDATVSVSPSSSEVCIGASVILTRTLTGGSNLVSTQWQINSGGWVDIAGQTGATYSPSTAVSGTTQYRVRVIDPNSGCSEPFSNIVTVIVQPNATVSITLNNAEVCIDGDATLTAIITGGSSALTYQWQSSPNGSSGWANIGGATSLTYIAPTNVAGTTWYRLQINDPQPSCSDPASNALSVLVKPDPTASIVAQNLEICVGGSSLLTATITGGSSQQTFQWQSNNGSWVNIAGATASTYTVVGSTPGTTQYRILVLDPNSGCPAILASNSVSIIVQPDATVVVGPVSTEVCVGGVAPLTATVTGGSSGVTYQWQSSPAGQNIWANIAGATLSTYNASTATAGNTDYRVIITDNLSGCSDPVSNAVLVIVRPDATVSIAPATSQVCLGGVVTINATIVGGSTSLTIQWQSSPDQTVWSNIPGATGPRV